MCTHTEGRVLQLARQVMLQTTLRLQAVLQTTLQQCYRHCIQRGRQRCKHCDRRRCSRHCKLHCRRCSVANGSANFTDDVAAGTASNIADDTVGSVADDSKVAAMRPQTAAKLAYSSQFFFLTALHLTIVCRAADNGSGHTSTLQTTTAAKKQPAMMALEATRATADCSPEQRSVGVVIKLGAPHTVAVDRNHCTTWRCQQLLVKDGDDTG